MAKASLFYATLKAPFFPCQLFPAGPTLVLGPLTMIEVVHKSALMSDMPRNVYLSLDTAQLLVLMAECRLCMVLVTSQLKQLNSCFCKLS